MIICLSKLSFLLWFKNLLRLLLVAVTEAMLKMCNLKEYGRISMYYICEYNTQTVFVHKIIYSVVIFLHLLFKTKRTSLVHEKQNSTSHELVSSRGSDRYFVCFVGKLLC